MSANHPWSGGEIIGYFNWQGNYVSAVNSAYVESVNTAIPFSNISSISGNPTNMSVTTGLTPPQQYPTNVTNVGLFTYTSGIPVGLGINCICIFPGYSDLRNTYSNSSFTNYTSNTSMITTAMNYLSTVPGNTLLGLTIGGGAATTGSWNTGSSTNTVTSPYNSSLVLYNDNCGIFSVYQAATLNGAPFSYVETGTGNTITGTGTGTLKLAASEQSYPFNCLIFDIETYGGYVANGSAGATGSSAQDFINLFTYIKTGTNSQVGFVGNSIYNISNPAPLIIVTLSHSCSTYNGSGSSLFCGSAGILSCGHVDYFSPQLYTCNLGTMNEYCANYQAAWATSPNTTNTFAASIMANPNWAKYGLNMIIPSLNTSSCYSTGGSNHMCPPNLYYYETDYNSQEIMNPNVLSSAPGSYYGGDMDALYTIDTGAVAFFNAVFGTSVSNVGGYIQWINGTISLGEVVTPVTYVVDDAAYQQHTTDVTNQITYVTQVTEENSSQIDAIVAQNTKIIAHMQQEINVLSKKLNQCCNKKKPPQPKPVNKKINNPYLYLYNANSAHNNIFGYNPK